MFAKAYFNNNQKNMYGKRLLDHYSLNHKYGGGVLFDACHEIDYLKFLFGPIKKSYSETFMNKQQTSTQIFHSIMIHKKKCETFNNCKIVTIENATNNEIKLAILKEAAQLKKKDLVKTKEKNSDVKLPKNF